MWHIACVDEKGDRFRYSASNYHGVSAQVTQLLAHGRKNYGDKVVKIIITNGHKPKPKAENWTTEEILAREG